MVASLYDIFFGLFVLIYYFRTITKFSDSFIIFAENFLLISGIGFGFVGLDSAANLRKINTRIYKIWRIFITFFIPFIELINNFSFFCSLGNNCNKLYNFLLTIIVFAVNIYLTRIAWSFNIRLIRNHELLIIHGKYLEKMINEESYKINDLRKYVPPELLSMNKSLPLLNDTNEMSIMKNKNISNSKV
jgi:hypothetical protein